MNYYINDKTGEKITDLFNKNVIDKKDYFIIMEYLSMDILTNGIVRSTIYVEFFNSLEKYITSPFYIEIKKILFVDFVHKIADMIIFYNFLDEDSKKVVDNKKVLKILLDKIDGAEESGYDFDRQKLEIIENQFERV